MSTVLTLKDWSLNFVLLNCSWCVFLLLKYSSGVACQPRDLKIYVVSVESSSLLYYRFYLLPVRMLKLASASRFISHSSDSASGSGFRL